MWGNFHCSWKDRVCSLGVPGSLLSAAAGCGSVWVVSGAMSSCAVGYLCCCFLLLGLAMVMALCVLYQFQRWYFQHHPLLLLPWSVQVVQLFSQRTAINLSHCDAAWLRRIGPSSVDITYSLVLINFLELMFMVHGMYQVSGLSQTHCLYCRIQTCSLHCWVHFPFAFHYCYIVLEIFFRSGVLALGLPQFWGLLSLWCCVSSSWAWLSPGCLSRCKAYLLDLYLCTLGSVLSFPLYCVYAVAVADCSPHFRTEFPAALQSEPIVVFDSPSERTKWSTVWVWIGRYTFFEDCLLFNSMWW